MKVQDLKQDKKNYRKHSERNKQLIKKSIDECGLGRSVVVDADGVLVAGNGVASVVDKNTPVRVIETDGSELVVVKRTDLHEGDVRRKKLALADNATADKVEWDFDNLQELDGLGVDVAGFDVEVEQPQELDDEGNYENKEEQVFERPLQLFPKQEYILLICEQSEFDEAREHFGLGFVLDTHARRKDGDERMVKARALKWADYKKRINLEE